MPVKHEKILGIAIMNACADAGWQVKRTVFSDSIKAGAKCLPAASFLAGERIVTFKGSGGPHRTGESLLYIIEDGCKDAGWEITERKRNSVTAAFNDDQGGSITVKICCKTLEYDQVVTVLGDSVKYHKMREIESEYKITCKGSKGMKYNPAKDPVNPVNEGIYILNFHMNEHIYKNLIL